MKLRIHKSELLIIKKIIAKIKKLQLSNNCKNKKVSALLYMNKSIKFQSLV
jgi:hypothetical protein